MRARYKAPAGLRNVPKAGSQIYPPGLDCRFIDIIALPSQRGIKSAIPRTFDSLFLPVESRARSKDPKLY